MKDVAQAAGVSIATASYALSGNGIALKVSPQTILRVQNAAAELNYVPNAVARDLRVKRTGQIGVLMSTIKTTMDESQRVQIDGALMMGLVQAIQDLELVSLNVFPRHTTANIDVTRYVNGRIDGLIILQADPWDATFLKELEAKRLPVVSIWSREVPKSMGFADTDNQGGGRIATEHLLALGHRRIGCLTREDVYPSNPHIEMRHAGYLEAMQKAGIPANQTFRARTYKAGMDLIDQGVTAFFMPYFLTVADFIKRLESEGLRVPEDISIVTFDDVARNDEVSRRLTTIYQPVQEMAIKALHHLVAMINGEDAKHCRSVIPTHLIVRETTAAPKNHQHEL
jgi:DNA-binding LacI/PurR family transcriptional regulator